MNILHACGVEISEGETLPINDEKKVVSVDGSELMVKVVRGMHMILGLMSLCCIPLTSLCGIPLDVPLEITTCACVGVSKEQIRRRMTLWETYRAILWELKLHGARGWQFWGDLLLHSSNRRKV
jgi:hypothetical protein